MTIQKFPSTYGIPTSNSPSELEGGLNLSQIKATLIRRIPLILKVAIGVTSIAAIKIFSSPLQYTSTFELLAESLQIETEVTEVGTPSSSDAREKIAFIELDDIELRKLSGNNLISRVVDGVATKYPDIDYRSVVGNLTLNLNTNNRDHTKNILQVGYQHSDPVQVTAVIEALGKVYLEHSRERRDQGVTKGIEFLNQEIPKVKAEVTHYQKELAQLKQQYQFVDLGTESNQISGRLSNLKETVTELEAEIRTLYLKGKNLDRENQQEPFTSTTAIDLGLPQYQRFIEQLSTLNTEIEQKSAIYQDNHPEVQLLEEQKAKIVQLIRNEADTNRQKINNEIALLETRKENLQAEINTLEKRIDVLPTISNDYDNIQQQLTIKNNKLSELETQRNALLIDTAQTQNPWQILTPPTRPQPNSSARINNLVLASVFGIFTGIGLALFRERYDNKIYSSDQLISLTGLPIISVIPHKFLGSGNSGKQKLLPKIAPGNIQDRELEHSASTTNNNSLENADKLATFGQSELPSFGVFCSLATNLGLFQPQSDIRSILITSATSAEGKSTIAINLAKASAVMGKRVLLVDANLRSLYGLTQRLSLRSDFGLRHLLSENHLLTESNFESEIDLIQQTSLTDNLYILGSGNIDAFITPNQQVVLDDPIRLLTSDKMSILMKHLEQHFDLIIYDAPSVLNYADVNLLAPETDGIILVTGVGKLETNNLQEAIDQLKYCNAEILGMVKNNLTEKV